MNPTRPRPRRTARPLVVLLVAGLTVLGLNASGVAAQAGTAGTAGTSATFAVVEGNSPAIPVNATTFYPGSPPAQPGACEGVDCEDDSNAYFVVKPSTPVASVQVTVTQAIGLAVYDTAGAVTVGTPRTVKVHNGTAYLPYTIATTTPGLHSMSVVVSATGVDPLTITLTKIWRIGSPAIAGNASLKGRAYGLTGTDYYSYGESDAVYRYAEATTFVGAGSAIRGKLPLNGKSSCSPYKCPKTPYRYDSARNLVQVGPMMGAIVGGRLYVVPQSVTDQPGAVRLLSPRASQRFNHTWTYRAAKRVDDWNGLGLQRLTLRKAGTFTLSYAAGAGPYDNVPRKTRKVSGRYQVAGGGVLKLTSAKSKRVLRANLKLVANASGKAAPNSAGIWLQQTYPAPKGKKTYVDQNLLRP